jgi:DNA-binding NarL/FixJ family response regulator
LQVTIEDGKIGFMGNGQSTAPDSFSAPTNPGDDPSSSISSPTNAGTPRYLLPKDLPQALRALSDQELDRLSAAVLVEQQRRGKKPPSNENAQARRVEEASIPMSTGKVNAVRAAFKAGLKPSQIARQFRISQANVRKALADFKSERKVR